MVRFSLVIFEPADPFPAPPGPGGKPGPASVSPNHPADKRSCGGTMKEVTYLSGQELVRRGDRIMEADAEIPWQRLTFPIIEA